jgi:sugar phosphate isomerase/epimerase
MDLCLYTDSVADLPFEAALDLAVEVGCRSIEIAGGGQSRAPHLRLDELLGDRARRRAFADAFSSRGLTIAALNCSAWPLHPVHGAEQERIVRDTIRLAGELGVETVVSMSGTPGDGAGATTVNWVFYPWPDDAVRLLERQWAIAISFWEEMARHATSSGVRHIAFELHPLHLVFNVPTLVRMREAVGPVIGANLDPSHLFWQGMDPLAVVAALGPAIHHVHLGTPNCRRIAGARRRPRHDLVRRCSERVGSSGRSGGSRSRPWPPSSMPCGQSGRRSAVDRERGSIPVRGRRGPRGGAFSRP